MIFFNIFKRKEQINPNLSESIITNIKSKYILEQIFNNLLKGKALLIIKPNKKLQKKLNLDINDYISFSEIEIELIPQEKIYGKFINILNKEDRIYYHIYFNDNKKEIRREYINEKDKIKKITIIIGHEIKSFEKLFYQCECIKSLSFVKFYRKDINNMSSMFYQCTSLKKLDLSNFITDNVNNMSRMFYDCSSLEELNVSNFNTKNVKNMRNMFDGCVLIKELNLSNFNTNNVIDMRCMFATCKALEKLNISNFNTNNVLEMNYMFIGCSNKLKNIIKEQNKNIKNCAF